MSETVDAMYKPDYDGDRPSAVLSAPERQALRAGKPDLIDRLHAAMLTQGAQHGDGPAGIRIAGIPKHLVEFSDRVGEEEPEMKRAVFEPTAAQVTDMPKALALLDGLRKHYYTVLKLRAFNQFAVENGETEPWPWDMIGEVFGFSEAWAESIYKAAIVQAARRDGTLPKVSLDHAIVVAAAYDHGFLTNLSTSGSPRVVIANKKAESPIRLERVTLVWVPRAEAAKAVVDRVKKDHRNLHSHGAWYRAHPDVLTDAVTETARSLNTAWLIEDVALKARNAAELPQDER